MAEENKKEQEREKRRREREKAAPQGGVGGKILAFVLGLFMGVVAVLGTVGGVAYYVWSRPIKSTLKLIDREENGEIYQLLMGENGYLDPKYADKKVGDLIKDVNATVKALSGDGSLQDLQALSPKVGDTVDKVLEKTDEYGIPISKEELMAKPVKQLSAYLEGQLKETSLGGLVKAINGAETNEPLLLALCYGEEGVDYNKTDDGKIEMINGAKAMTVSGLLSDGGISGAMDKIALESVSDKIDKDDPVMRTLAYGPASHYTATKDEEGKVVDVQMNQILYTWDGEKLYDIDGAEIDGSLDEGKTIITLADGTKYYVKAATRSATPVTYYAYKDEKHTEKALYPKMKISDLMGNTSSLVDGLYLGDALKVNGSSHRILAALAYGEGFIVNDEDNSISPAEGNSPRTIGDLKKNSEEIINGLTLASALNVTPESHNVLITLAYGKEGRDYVVEDGVFKMQGDSKPRTLQDFSGNIGDLLNDIVLADVIKPDYTSPIIMYLLYGRANIHYEVVTEGEEEKAVPLKERIAVFDGKAYNAYGEELSGEVQDGVYTVTQGEGDEAVTTRYECVEVGDAAPSTLTLPSGETATYYFLKKDGKDLYYQPTTIGDLSGENNAISMLSKRLTIEEILGKESVQKNIFLKHLTGETIDTLPTAIQNLKITDVYAKEIFAQKQDEESEKTYYVDKNGDFFLDGEGKKIGDVEEDIPESIKDDLVVTGTWWYLLHNEEACHLNGHCELGDGCLYKDGDDDTTCTAKLTHCPNIADGKSLCYEKYTIEKLNDLIGNMTKNIKSATLRQLKADGIMPEMKDSTLDARIITEFKSLNTSTMSMETVTLQNTYGKTYLGEFTVMELLAYVDEFLGHINRVQPSS